MDYLPTKPITVDFWQSYKIIRQFLLYLQQKYGETLSPQSQENLSDILKFLYHNSFYLGLLKKALFQVKGQHDIFNSRYIFEELIDALFLLCSNNTDYKIPEFKNLLTTLLDKRDFHEDFSPLFSLFHNTSLTFDPLPLAAEIKAEESLEVVSEFFFYLHQLCDHRLSNECLDSLVFTGGLTCSGAGPSDWEKSFTQAIGRPLLAGDLLSTKEVFETALNLSSYYISHFGDRLEELIDILKGMLQTSKQYALEWQLWYKAVDKIDKMHNNGRTGYFDETLPYFLNKEACSVDFKLKKITWLK